MRGRARAALALAVALVALAGSPPIRAFDVHRHAFMVHSALAGDLRGNALAAAIAGVIYPDVAGCALDGYCDGWKRIVTQGCRGGASALTGLLTSIGRPAQGSIGTLAPDHFDDDTIERGRDRAESRLARARGILQRIAPSFDSDAERREFVGAMLLFGAVLHATQDFYAHSNYVECHTRNRDVDLRSVDLWDGRRDVPACEGATTDAHDPARTLRGLVSGVYYGANDSEEDGEFPAGANKTHHADINKDNPDDAAPQGKRPLRRSGDPRDLYAAVSGQIGDQRGVTDAYTRLGLAVRHSQAAFRALADGRPLFGSRTIRPQAGAIDPVRLTPRSSEDPVRRLLAVAAEDAGVLSMLQQSLEGTGFAGCLLGPDNARTLFRFLD